MLRKQACAEAAAVATQPSRPVLPCDVPDTEPPDQEVGACQVVRSSVLWLSAAAAAAGVPADAASDRLCCELPAGILLGSCGPPTLAGLPAAVHGLARLGGLREGMGLCGRLRGVRASLEASVGLAERVNTAAAEGGGSGPAGSGVRGAD